MSRRFFITISFIFLFFVTTILAPFSYAVDINDLIKKAGSEKYLEEFCQSRSGNQMNLETWYSGKCKDASGKLTDPFSGDGVGFSSIVLLDIAEKIQGKKDPNKSIFDVIKDTINFFSSHGISMNSEQSAKFIAQKRQEIMGINNGGLMGSLSEGIAMLIDNPPASTTNYVAYVSQNLQNHHIIPQALAATNTGVGFTGLSPLLPIWRAVRNLAYVLFILVFIIYGFMMMFRVNIAPKTVITIQLALPKLILTLLMITFSYAIVGLMVDLMYVIFYGLFSLLAAQGLIILNNPISKIAVNSASGQWGSFVSFIINSLVAIPASAIGIINLAIGGPTWLSGAIALGLSPFFGFLVFLIIIIAVVISYIKLFFKLVLAFLEVCISLITAPIVLLANALPGNDTFGSWLRGIFANLAVFPVAMLLLLFSYMLMVQPLIFTANNVPVIGTVSNQALFGVKDLSSGTNFFSIPLVSTPLGGPTSDGILALLGVALLLMASKYVDIVKDALKVPAFKYGAAIGEALKGGYQYAPWLGGSRTETSGAYQTIGTMFGLKTSPASSSPWHGRSTTNATRRTSTASPGGNQPPPPP